ncbi:SusC/RagA family TonB-linked outer membrane protein [Porphyromonas levii]|uniref:SusC/RagA family TonB-linked outer membrane protein n=1 Tax=Porphyromonas levii TaxID=28114 RepID=UPI001BAB3E23|nr:SusC/RagA family TonB-linked outer membrane protein [Porphyromonas levii]MBR8765909.1 TonB-dependent receptor P3 [Porphyromonas levii]MBR8803155.1 TonB-dependent receptor P3 [Porphyromonas levii]
MNLSQKSWLKGMCILLLSLLAPAAFAQTITVKGVVTDATHNEPVIGATVMLVQDTSKGMLTNLDGAFTLSGVPSNGTLRVSYVGYKTVEVPINGKTTINIVLQEDSELLDEVVVTALGIKRSEKALSYNVQKIKSDAINSVKDANFINSLNGKVAGVNITKSSAGIGGATKVVMRGSKSIAGNNNVLYVVDGMPIGNQNIAGDGGAFSAPGGGEGISDFNSDNIESISVLTGPSAAALYGAAAANGVIIINTKKGEKGALKVNFSSNTEWLSPSIMPEFQNKYGSGGGTYMSWGELLKAPSSFDPKAFFKTGFSTINTINFSGGTEMSRTFMSVGTTHSKGVIPNNEYYRYNFDGRNTSSFFDDRLHVDLSASYVIQGDQNMMSGGRYFNPLVSLYLFPRGDDFENVKRWERFSPERKIYLQYWPYGDGGIDLQNPYWIVNRNLFYNNKHRYMFNARVQYDIFDWMNIAGRVRIDNSYTTISRKLYASTPSLHVGDTEERPMGSFRLNEERYKQTYADVMLNINKPLGEDWFLTANIGSSFDDHYTTGVIVGGTLSLIPNFFSTNNVVKSTAPNGQNYKRTRNVAIFASGELGWKRMMYLTLTGRSDWASQLVSNGKTPAIFYPSVGLSGVISEMVKLPDWFSYLKVRGSFTEVGSPISMTGVTPGTITYTMEPSKINPIALYPFPEFRPERTRSFEVGLNAKFFNGDLSIDATLYQSNTHNQTFLQELSGGSAYTGFYVQAGDIRNRGIEAAIGYQHTWGDFYWGSNLTYTRNVNRVMQLAKGYTNPIDGTTFDIDLLSKPKRMSVGDSMDDIFVQGILLKGPDGKLIEEGDGFKVDRTSQIIKVGKSAPDFMMGWSNNFAYKGVTFNFLINSRFGGVVTSTTQAMLDAYGVSKVSADARDAGGVVVDGVTYDAERYYKTIGGKSPLLAYYLYDATQIKLQELSVGYSLPKQWLGNYVNNAHIALIGRNLFTIYRAAPYDVDMSGGVGTYSGGSDNFMPPSTRSLGFSLKLGF